MEVLGYKAFNKDFTNRYGRHFEVGGTYSVKGDLSWGKYGNGFHFCTNIEDCFRYYDPDTSIIAEVKGFGRMVKNDDEYYGYYDMYVCEKIEIIRLISRKEIISMMLEVDFDRQERFIRSYNLTEIEKELFYMKCGGDKNERDYYQRCQGKQFKKYRY